MADQLYRMRAPNGQEQDVPKAEVDFFRRRGAVLVGPADGRPAAPSPIYDAATSGNITGTGAEALVRRGLGALGQFQSDAARGVVSSGMTLVNSAGDLARYGANKVLPEGYQIDPRDPEGWAARSAEMPNSAGGIVGRVGADIAGFGKVLKGAQALGTAAKFGRAGMLGTEMAAGAGMSGLQTGGDTTAMVAGAAFPAATAVRGLLPAGVLGRTGKLATDAAIGAGTGYVLSGGDPDMVAAGAIGLPAVTGGRAAAAGLRAGVGRAAAGAGEGGLGGAIGSVLRGAAPEDPLRMIVQAVKPRNSLVNFDKNLPNVAGRIRAVADAADLPLNNLDNVLEATKEAKKATRAHYDEIAGPFRGMGVDMTPVSQQQIASIPRSLAIENPQAYARAVARAKAYDGLVVPLEKAEQLLTESNAALEGHYAKFPQSQRKQLRADPRIAALDAKAKAIRDAIYGALDHPSLPTSARETNRTYGQLMEFEDALLRRRNVANRQQPESLSEQFGKVRAVGEAAKGLWRLSHGDPTGLANLAGARAQSAAATWMKEQQTTDNLLKRAFARVRPADEFPLVAPVAPGPHVGGPVVGQQGQTQAQLPGGQRVWTAGAAPDTSGPVPGNGPAAPAQAEIRPGQKALPPQGQTEMGPGADPSRVMGVPADIPGGISYADFQKAFDDEIKAAGGQPPKRVGGGQAALSVAGPLANLAPDDPDSKWDDYAKLALNLGSGAAAFGMAARTFPPELKKMLDAEQAFAKKKQLQDYLKAGGVESEFKVHDSGVETHVKNVVRKMTGGNSREAERIINAYETIPLPIDPKTGIDFDERKPLHEVLDFDEPGTATTTTDRSARGSRLSDWSQKRMDAAYDEGAERAKTEGWGDPRYLYHLTNGDPQAAVQLSRLFGAFSPGQKTDANSLQGVEAFIRSAMGESADDILGRKVPDPGRPGKEKRVGGSMSFKHVRPSTVQDNLERAIKLGRLFQEKVEALSAAEVGIKDQVPIDMWLLRALGAESDVTPGASFYRLVSEAVTKAAAKKGEAAFPYMAKAWMGMQKIAGAETPSFQASVSKTRLPGPITNRAVQEAFVANPEFHGAAIRDKAMSDVGEVFPLADNPKMSYENFLPELHQQFKAGTGSDVLGKQTVVQNPKPVTLADMRLEAQASLMADALEGQPRVGRGPGRYILKPDGTTQFVPFSGFTASGKPRPYKVPKGSVTIKEYKPKAPKAAKEGTAQ